VAALKKMLKVVRVLFSYAEQHCRQRVRHEPENLLCKIQTDNANLSHGYLLSSDVTQHHLGTLRCRWQVVSTPSLLSDNQHPGAAAGRAERFIWPMILF